MTADGPPRSRKGNEWYAAGALALVAVIVTVFIVSGQLADDDMGGMDMGGDDMGAMDMGGSDSGAGGTIDDLPQAPVSSVSRMGDMVMPPGMIMTADQSMEAMGDMAAVPEAEVDATPPAGAVGDRPMVGREVDGVLEFDLTASVVRWNILDDTSVLAYAFNEQVPGPRLALSEGDRVRIRVENDLPEPTTVHWHGLDIPNAMDGPGGVTQDPIEPGDSFTYAFAVDQAGTFFYHSHTAADRQQALGLSGALIVEPTTGDIPVDQDVVVQIQEWTVREGYTFPSMPMEGLLPNFFTLNGKAWPATPAVQAEVGDRIRFRFIGSGAFSHPMHIHGGPFEIVATDGSPVPEAARLTRDTVEVAPGQRYDVVWTATRPGTWLMHCHINHHLTNDGQEQNGAGGLTMAIEVAAGAG